MRGKFLLSSQVLCAPTFSANRMSLRHFGLEEKVGELNQKLVELSRQAAGGKALVAGDLSTMGQPLEPVGSLSYGAAYDIYREQMVIGLSFLFERPVAPRPAAAAISARCTFAAAYHLPPYAPGPRHPRQPPAASAPG